MMKPPISRRTMLKGVGAATIGLPLLEEMWGAPSHAVAAAADAKVTTGHAYQESEEGAFENADHEPVE